MTDPLPTLRDAILLAALPHVPFDGWTRRAMRRGAEDAGYDAAAADRAFPYGAADMVTHYSDLADRRMADELTRRDIGKMKIRERVATIIRVRLEQAAPHKDAVRRGLSVLALPPNAPAAMRALYRTVDAVWRAAGDTSTDWNFYTKRGLLAGVYSTTVLCWLDDVSDGSVETWEFLDRRIADVMRVPQLTGRVRGAFGKIARPFQGRTYTGAGHRP
jgi:ubiquinone biosynthesis protein COQ9